MLFSNFRNGKECTLKEIDSEPEDRPRPYYRPRFPRRKIPYQRPRRDTNNSQFESRQNSTSRDRNRPTRTFRRRQQTDGGGDSGVTKVGSLLAKLDNLPNRLKQ